MSAKDPDGSAFGAKVSPWTEAGASASGLLRLGQSGLRARFPLGAGAPAAAADVRFADVTKLRVRLMVSMAPTQGSAFKAVSSLLPSSVADGMAKGLDESVSVLEGEALIPLANILSGRPGVAADRAVGGWMPLSVVGGEAEPPGSLEPPLSLWLQMYAVPDHAALLPKLQSQLEEELLRFNGGVAPSGGPRAGAAQPQGPRLGGAADAQQKQPPPRWGPAGRANAFAAAHIIHKSC